MIKYFAIAFLSASAFFSCTTKDNTKRSVLRYETRTFRVTSDGDCEGDTSSCASYSVEYPVFEGLSPAVDDSLTLHISRAVDTGNPLADTLSFEIAGRKFIQDFKEAKEEFPEGAMGWYYNASVEVNVMSDTLLSLAASTESFTGGAHGGFGKYFINLNPSTGAAITLNDFYKIGYDEALRQSAEAAFRQALEIDTSSSLADAGFEFADDKFKLNSNYGFTDKGIVFVFNIYEIGPYILGAQEILVPYEKIKEWRK